MQDATTTTLQNTWEVDANSRVWTFGASDETDDVRNNTARILHVSDQRAAARGTAVIPVSPLHAIHFVRFRVVEEEDSYFVRYGTIGVTDSAAPFDDSTGGRSWGVELCDGGWRYCSDAHRSAEQRGALIRSPDAGAIVTLRIDCHTRALSVALDDQAFVEMPMSLPDDVRQLSPWAVSAFSGDAFELHSVEASLRARWSPASHARFPLAAREFAVVVLLVGYRLAMRLPDAQQGALCELFVSNVLPVVMDAHECS
jgi:hypothetical protein